MTREELLVELVQERFGPRPIRERAKPWEVARRRRILNEAMDLPDESFAERRALAGTEEGR